MILFSPVYTIVLQFNLKSLVLYTVQSNNKAYRRIIIIPSSSRISDNEL